MLSDFAAFTHAQIIIAGMIRKILSYNFCNGLCALCFLRRCVGGKVGDKHEREYVYKLSDEEYYDFAAIAFNKKTER